MMSATATCLSVSSWRQNLAIDETSYGERRKAIQSPTRNWTRSRESPERQTRGSIPGSRRAVAGERTPEQRMQARSARFEKLNQVCGWGGRCDVPEADRKKLHFEMKTHTNHFETWLVEMVYPAGVGMPDCIKAKVAVSPNHPKYWMPVNHFITLADAIIQSEKQAQIPSSMLSLLDKLIDERGLYSHLMAHPQVKSVNDDNEEYEKHQHFIDVVEDVRTILGGRSMEVPRTAELRPTPAVKPTDAGISRSNSTLGKRKTSVTSLDGSEECKVAKKASASASAPATQQRPMHVLRRNDKPITLSSKSEGIDKTCAAAVKPMSWASIASAGVAA